MTEAFTDMIYLFSCGAMGMKPDLEHEINIDEIYKHAVSQGVWHTVFLAVSNLYKESKLKIEHELFECFQRQTFEAVVVNTKRLCKVHDIIQTLEAEGVKTCVLKGEILSNLYNNPSCRISGDTDILIGIENKNKAIKILKKCGFEVSPQGATSNQIVAVHKVAGVIELHVDLYSVLFKDVWFDKKTLNQEEYIRIKTENGYEITTLGISDGLIFIALHYIKHFLYCGVGIRQLMDVLLYMKKYNEEIDWDRFNSLMSHLKYQKFIEHSIGIGIKYFNFKKEHLPECTYDESIVDSLLSDIELGGVFGKNDKSRDGFYMRYTKARFKRFKKDDYNAYINKWWRPNLVSIIFPHIKNLAAEFPYLKKLPLLYPAVWLYRMIKIIISFIKKEKTINTYISPGDYLKENDIIRQRMDLIYKLDMI